ncbi:unnamed protein product [Thelazia callipaeda]|uniref:Myeloid leukemia factor n=1 Tax=Thelazia callipaeda TaxID=103827 RepID=A0A0N5CWM7_THECL|nr:unnamed protein product [Thelazia callipaeda]
MRHQMREMDQMMNSLMDPFGMFNRHSMIGGMLEDTPRTQSGHRDDMALMSPFGGFGGGLFGGIMRQMEDMQTQAMNDPNSLVFSHSTMITYDGRNGGQPRVVEKSIRKTGDVQETRHAVRTGQDGVGDKLTIGHTIGDRTHVIEKKHEAEEFDREFASRARRNMTGNRNDGHSVRAIENGNYGSASSNRNRHVPRVGGMNGPIITLPDEDDIDAADDDYSRGKRSNTRSAAPGGPVIREVTDDEDDGGNHKRRKGISGRLFRANDE